MRDELTGATGVSIERGTVIEVLGDAPDFLYRVESATRAGVTSRPMEDIHRPIYRTLRALRELAEREHQASIPDDEGYRPGDEVYFFMFADGRGLVIGRMART